MNGASQGMNCASFLNFFSQVIKKGRAHRELRVVFVAEAYPVAARQHVGHAVEMPDVDDVAFVYPDEYIRREPVDDLFQQNGQFNFAFIRMDHDVFRMRRDMDDLAEPDGIGTGFCRGW